jgi:small subunit ribosomal protein S15
MVITNEDKKKIIQNFGHSSQDTGSSAVQVALLTHKIVALTQHCKQHPKDYSTRRGLLQMVCNRKKLLMYLARVDETSYRSVIQRLELKK